MKTTNHTTGEFVNQDGINIFYQYWLPETEHIGNLIIAHGIGEHSGRYRNILDLVLPKGMAVYALDHQGHGKSGGKRGHVKHFHNYARDMKTMCGFIRDKWNDKPPILLGHSLGGLIAMDFLLQYPDNLLNGVVFSSPAFGIKVPVPAWKHALAKMLNHIAPSFTMPNGINPDDLSHDRNEVEKYKKDELVHDMASVSFFLSMLEVIEDVHKNANQVNIPILLMLGENDNIINIDDATKMFSLFGTEDKKQYICPISNHELFNEVEKKQNLDILWDWIQSKL